MLSSSPSPSTSHSSLAVSPTNKLFATRRWSDNPKPDINSELQHGSPLNYITQAHRVQTTPDPPRLEDLQLQDASCLTPGNISRKRHLSQGEQQQQHKNPPRPRPQPKVFAPNYEDGTHRVFAGAKKHSTYDFDSPVASMSMLDAPKSDLVNTMTPQVETRQITEEQLINEVRTIYAGLVLVEKKCVEIDRQQAKNPASLTNEQWQALIALHRTLLHEHHDFFLASQHPSASPSLKKLASRYAMPARMWRHGIHSFLELLRHRLPEALDHMLAFIYTAYSMMALLLESVPSFEDTWIECLGDLARYRMAVEESDLRDREVWAGVARYWYNKAADKSPDVGRIQHHLAVLARPNILLQLFFYSKSLVCVQPFPNTRESILLLFNPLLDPKEPMQSHHSPVMLSFVKAHGTLFGKQSILSFLEYGLEFMSYLGTQIGRVGSKWREQGVYIASANFASLLEYGGDDSLFMKLFRTATDPQSGGIVLSDVKGYYKSLDSTSITTTTTTTGAAAAARLCLHPVSGDLSTFQNSSEVVSYSACFTFRILAFVLKHIGDKNVLPHVHVSLAFIFSLAQVPEAMAYIQSEIPWQGLVTFLNTLNTQGLHEARLKSENFPLPESGARRHLPEDFPIRGQIWSRLYYPSGFFDYSRLDDDDERALEPPSVTAPRTERCLWLGHRLASLDAWIAFDEQQKKFFVTDFAWKLESRNQGIGLFTEAARFFEERHSAELRKREQEKEEATEKQVDEDNDREMIDAPPASEVKPHFRTPDKS